MRIRSRKRFDIIDKLKTIYVKSIFQELSNETSVKEKSMSLLPAPYPGSNNIHVENYEGYQLQHSPKVRTLPAQNQTAHQHMILY